jgi:aminoglycoside phosphotransferase (APT) family kinase protein
MSAPIDEARDVRDGERLDEGRLGDFLRDALQAPDAPLEVKQFRGGHSNLTYLVRLGDDEYVLRRPPFGAKIKTGHDMAREHRVLSALWKVYDKAPRAVLHCTDESVVGAEFYLTERARGFIPRRDFDEAHQPDEAGAAALCSTFVDALVELHAVDYEACGLGDLGRPDGFVERQVTGWTKRYAKAKTDDLADVDTVAAWLASNMPQSPTPTLIHNDFKYDNLVFDPDDLGKIRAVLDWEMCTLGDPLMDLGTSLAYWVEADDDWAMQAFRLCPTHIPGSYTRAQLAQAYGERSGRDVSQVVFYYVFGLFKVAVIAQQIYARFAAGKTEDPRFAAFIEGVRALSAQAARQLERESL